MIEKPVSTIPFWIAFTMTIMLVIFGMLGPQYFLDLFNQ